MFSPTVTLQNFIQPVPVCKQQAKIEALLLIFQSGQYEYIVVVNKRHFPVGIISCRRLMSYLALHLLWKLKENCNSNLSFSNNNSSSSDIFSLEVKSLIEPIAILPDRTSANQLGIQNEGFIDRQPYALVDSSKKFIGLLDSCSLLKYLLDERNRQLLRVCDAPEPESLSNIQEPLKKLRQGAVNLAIAQEVYEQACNRKVDSSILTGKENNTSAEVEFHPQFPDCPKECSSKEESSQETAAENSEKQLTFGSPAWNPANERSNSEGSESWSQDFNNNNANPRSVSNKTLILAPWTEDNFDSEDSIASLSGTAEKLDLERNSKEQFATWLIFATEVWQQQQLLHKELAAKNVDLSQLNLLKDDFLACISHELKSPLTAIMGLVSLLKEKKLGELNQRQTRYVELIARSSRQLMTLVNDILDFIGLETGELKLIPEPIKIKTACQQAYESIGEKPEDRQLRQIEFILEIEADLEIIVADKLRLHQMLVHLLDNALKLTHTGGKIGLRVNRWQNWIAFTVWDTGIGIPEPSQNSIFQKCQHLESPFTDRVEGIGLGLILTHRLARAHGGDISFISKVDRGSEFTVLLPWSLTHKEINPKKTSNDRLILIAETIPRYIENLSDRLMGWGYRVVIARSGTEALEKARQLKPDLIFLNPVLPLLSGWDVLSLLRSDTKAKNIPIILTATQTDKQHGEFKSADGFLPMPVEEEALKKTLIGLDTKLSFQTKNLKILNIHEGPNKMGWIGSMINSSELWNLNHRILEADSLEQADMLARIWKIDAIVLDSSTIEEEPLAYLQALKEYQSLACLPLVTLDARTTEAANQVSGLSVFPCLFTVSEQTFSKLLEVIQIAAGVED